ncbi:MAG: Cytosol aminopeptidase, partial [Pseudomonadota bacterium]
LTGACVIALGAVRTGLFSSDDALALQLQQAGETSGDTCWRMPLDEEYADGLKSRFADVANVAGRAAGSVTAAKFLQAPADKGLPDACDRIAEILAQGYGVHPDIKRAAEYYRCAGLGFLKEGRKDEVAQVIGKMRGFLPSNHMYIVELYAKLITREPNYPWRIPSETAALLEKSVGWGKVPGPGEDGAKSHSSKTH